MSIVLKYNGDKCICYNLQEFADHGYHVLVYMHSAEHEARADVYQLGIILLELITGKHITSQSQVDFQRIQV